MPFRLLATSDLIARLRVRRRWLSRSVALRGSVMNWRRSTPTRRAEDAERSSRPKLK